METLLDRLEEAASTKGKTLSGIATSIGLSRAAASRWRSGGGLSPEVLNKIAELLNVDAVWLKTGKRPYSDKANKQIIHARESVNKYESNADVINESRKVPLIDMVAAGDWTDVADPYPVGDAESWELCPVPHGQNTFAVRINGESMLPKFQNGDIIFCDPSQYTNNGDYVIAKLIDDNQATFKQLVIEDGEMMLKAINPNWHTTYIPINGNCHVLGKVIARLEKF